ncbi:uncharacterized protein LOC117532050 [Thalassophryne amazonica]|uniref:uncharacterized protein LOC117532050 n=1 Tax=Thalassophryne amazonica TaxID=390379 RepID=UPI00147103DF|nr:uncharacterized protein LOC117532050 [Thalassophryne amazonica]
MGKPLSRPGCFRKSSCCLEKHGAGDGALGGRDGGVEGGYGDGYIPQRSIYDTMCINQQIDSHHHHHHHHPGDSMRREGGDGGSYSYSASGSLRVSRSPTDFFDSQPRSLTPNPSFVRRLDERAIYDSLKLGAEDIDGNMCHSPGRFTRSVSPSVSSFSAPGVSSSSSKKYHHHHHHHGDSTKSRDSRHSWKVLTPPKQLECLELSTSDMMDRGDSYLNPGHYPPPGGQSSINSPLISPFSNSPSSSGYRTPVFFSPAKPRPSQTQSLRCSPPHVIQPRHYSQTQSLRLSPPHELRRSRYQSPLAQLSAHDLEQDIRDRGWGRSEREKEWEREREREMERGWAQREWERERERGRLERERARERERRETTFGTFGYGRAVPLHSDRDSVFLDSDQVLDTAPLLIPQPSPSPSTNAAPRMGTGAVGRNRPGSKVGPENLGGVMVFKYDNGSAGLMLIDSKAGGGTRSVTEAGPGTMPETKTRSGIHNESEAEPWSKYDNGARVSVKKMTTKTGSQVTTRSSGRDLEGKVQSGVETENGAPAVSKDGPRELAKGGDISGRGRSKLEPIVQAQPSILTDAENRSVPGDKAGAGSGQEMKVEIEAGVANRARSSHDDLREKSPGVDEEDQSKCNNKVVPAVESRVEPEAVSELKIDTMFMPDAKLYLGAGNDADTKITTETEVMDEGQKSPSIAVEVQISDRAENISETAPTQKDHKKHVDIDKSESSHVVKASRAHKSKTSKSTSRTRPGTATGLRPGVLSPRLSRGLVGLESPHAEGTESTWPRRIIVRKRTVRQGGALHNLPILPPLPSVLSALEKRRPHAHLQARSGHVSENQLSNVINAAGIVGRCSFKEPSHVEPGHVNVVGRASLREQNLEHWRVCRDQDESRRARGSENKGEQKETTVREDNKWKEQKREKESNQERHRKDEKVGIEGDKVMMEQLIEKTEPEKEKRRPEEQIHEGGNRTEEVKKEIVEIKYENVEDSDIEREDGTQERHGKGDEEEVVKVEMEEDEDEGGGGPFGEPAEMESWDAVLDMMNTLWDEGCDKGGTAGGDSDSLSGSLQRWPLLRPPVGFGGSHPPSSAASELSLTELERRARELDSDLEHLDLSQPHRDSQEFYQTHLEPQRERSDMYQTHPGPQREKAALLTGVGSRSQVSLKLSASTSPSTDTERPVDWSSKSAAGTPTVTSSAKEDSSPDSNLTLESDSSGVFLSLSNQSQEDAGSDSDQPVSGSDLGSSSTSLDKDVDDGGLKEWGREESAELQWCYPSLLNTPSHEDVEGTGLGVEDGGGQMEQDEGRHKDVSEKKDDKTVGMVSIMKTPLDLTDLEGTTTFSALQSEKLSPRKKVIVMGTDSFLSLSPSKQHIKHLLDSKQPIRSSGLDCGDINPYVQSDSFVYLAVSTRPTSRGELTAAGEVSTHDTTQDSGQKQVHGLKPHQEQPNTDSKPTHLNLQKPEEGDFLCTDSFVYLAAPACLLLGPTGSAPYSGRESDSESSGSGPVDLSVLGCGSVAGDSDWDSDLSDSDPSRSSRMSAAANKSSGMARPKRLPAEPGWDLFGETTEPEVLRELFMEQDKTNNNNSKAWKASGVTVSMAVAPAVPMATHSVAAAVKATAAADHLSTTKKVTWQFKPAQRSVCTTSRKDKEKELTASPLVRVTQLGGGEAHRPSPSSSSSSSPSSSSSSSG